MVLRETIGEKELQIKAADSSWLQRANRMGCEFSHSARRWQAKVHVSWRLKNKSASCLIESNESNLANQNNKHVLKRWTK